MNTNTDYIYLDAADEFEHDFFIRIMEWLKEKADGSNFGFDWDLYSFHQRGSHCREVRSGKKVFKTSQVLRVFESVCYDLVF